MTSNRIDNTDEIGLAILQLVVQRQLGWIIREVRKKDVGIDANIEQVVEGNPTAKYISIHLKTGLGNVYQATSGDFVFYFDEPHYLYWTSSSIPVVFVLCDPNTDTLYWAAILRNRIKKTPKGYSLKISSDSQISENTKFDFETLINTYQGDTLIPDDVNTFSPEEKSEFANALMSECSTALKSIREEIDSLDEVINTIVEKGNLFVESYSGEFTKEQSDRFITQSSSSYAYKLNVCRMRFKANSSIVTESHITALRLADELYLLNGMKDDVVLLALIKELKVEYDTIVSLISTLDAVIEHFSTKPMIKNATSIRAERSFALVVEDYTANLRVLSQLIKECVDRFCLE